MRKFLWNITWLIFRPLLNIFCRFEVKGLENLKNLQKPFIMAAAIHANYADSYIIGAAFPFNCDFFPIRYMTAEEYIKVPILGMIITAYGAFPVKKGRGIDKVTLSALNLLNKGETVGIFIEGKLSKTGKLDQPQSGAAYLALKTNLPVLPVALNNTFGLNPVNFFLRRKRIKVAFGRPIFVQDFNFGYNNYNNSKPNKDSVIQFKRIIMDKIKELI